MVENQEVRGWAGPGNTPTCKGNQTANQALFQCYVFVSKNETGQVLKVLKVLKVQTFITAAVKMHNASCLRITNMKNHFIYL